MMLRQAATLLARLPISATRMRLATLSSAITNGSVCRQISNLSYSNLLYRSAMAMSQMTQKPFLVERINELTQKDVLTQEMLLGLDKVDKEQQQLILRLIVQKLEEGTLENKSLTNRILLQHLKAYPQLEFEAFFDRIQKVQESLQQFIIEQNQDGQKMAIKDINNSFVICFSALKRVKQKDEALTKAVAVNRMFGNYHSNFLYHISGQHSDDMLKKSCQFFKVTFLKLNQLTKILLEKRQQYPQEDPEQIEDEEVLKFMQNNQYLLTQTARFCGMTLFDYMEAMNTIHENQIQRKRTVSPQDQEPIHKGLFELIPYLDQCEAIYGQVSSPLSTVGCYYKVRKLTNEIKYYKQTADGLKEDLNVPQGSTLTQEQAAKASQKTKRDQKILNQFLDSMYALQNEILLGIREQQNNEDQHPNLQEATEVLLAIRMNYADEEQEIQLQKKEAANIINDILRVISNRNLRTLVKAHLIAVVERVKEFDVTDILDQVRAKGGRRGRGK